MNPLGSNHLHKTKDSENLGNDDELCNQESPKNNNMNNSNM